MGKRVGSARLAAGGVIGLALVWAGCGSTAGSGFGDGGVDAGLDATTDATLTGDAAGDTGKPIKLGGGDSGGSKCKPSTCSQLKATCGAVTDTKCGGIVQCGSCTSPKTCGGGGVPNQCGTVSGGGDACVKQTCASQKITCGQAGDGCGGVLQCGGCTSPQTCGGDPAKPGVCGCTGTCAAVPTCEAGTTTLTGKVYDPAGTYGLYNALVYIPNNPSDPGLKPFPPGITCDVCGASAAGDPLVTAMTAPDGSFTLSGVPVGAAVPVVIQLGRWRRQFTIPITTACGANTLPTPKTLSMPQNHSQGDLPRIAILSGALDPVECVLLKIGISNSEFSDPGGAGYINFFKADGSGTGAVYSGSTPAQASLFATTGAGDGGTQPIINNYDMALLECEGYAQAESAPQQAALAAYAGAGGRVFASDFAYSWLYQNPALSGSANWGGNHSGAGYAATATIDQPPVNPTGAAFQQWLQNVGVSTGGTVAITPAFPNVTSITLPTQEWLHGPVNGAQGPIHFTFNTPIGAAAANQCGRVTFSDWHAQSGVYSNGATFPNECPGGALTPQEAILEFMLFDLSACVQPYTPVCAGQTCTQQGIQCGPAGDGCGNEIQCGTCPTGQICGITKAGQCGSASK